MKVTLEKNKTAEIILVLVGAFIVCFWIWDKKIFLLLGLVLVAITIISPALSYQLAKLWMKLGALIGMVMSKILLTIVYFIFLLPLAIMYRFVKKDFLNLNRKESTYYTPRDHQYNPKDLENIW